MPSFTQIDDSSRGDHSHLRAEDTCFYLYEYTSGRDFSFSQTNNLINNLKKKPSLAGSPQYKYKTRAIQQCAAEFQSGLTQEAVSTLTFVSIPGSKVEGHPDFDNRMELVCRLLGPNVDVRRLVVQSRSTEAAHEAGPDATRVTVEELLEIYSINEELAQPEPTYFAIVDDVLTAGTHFRAMKTILTERFPSVPVIGLFVARRVFAAPPTLDDLNISDF